MTQAIALRLAETDCGPVNDLLHKLAAAGIADDTLRFRYAPHVTLAVYPDEADSKALAATAAALTVQWKALRIRFAGLGVFANDPAVLTLAPIVTSALLVRHAQLLARHPATGSWASGAWVPQVTLSASLATPSALAAAVELVSAQFTPFEATLNSVDLVRFAPLQIMFSGALADG